MILNQDSSDEDKEKEKKQLLAELRKKEKTIKEMSPKEKMTTMATIPYIKPALSHPPLERAEEGKQEEFKTEMVGQTRVLVSSSKQEIAPHKLSSIDEEKEEEVVETDSIQEDEKLSDALENQNIKRKSQPKLLTQIHNEFEIINKDPGLKNFEHRIRWWNEQYIQ